MADALGIKCTVVAVGNPGAGKSTLLNSLMKSKDRNFNEHLFFESGVRFGEQGIKCKTDKRIIGNTTYMEVSGVDNEETRREAAHTVGDVLRQGGKYLLLFIVTLDAGRVRPDDINLVSLVLDQNKDINCYGVIFNKITDGILRELNEDPNNRNIVITQLTNTGGERPVPLPLFLHRDERLEDANKVVVEIPSLEKFISMVPLLDARVRAGNYPVEN